MEEVVNGIAGSPIIWIDESKEGTKMKTGREKRGKKRGKRTKGKGQKRQRRNKRRNVGKTNILDRLLKHQKETFDLEFLRRKLNSVNH